MNRGWAVFLAVVLPVIVLMPSWGGLSITSDSVTYMSSATSLLAGKGYRDCRDNIEMCHPPLYAVALTPFLKIGMTPNDAASGVNYLSIVVLFLCAWSLAWRLTKHGWLALAAGVLVAANPVVVGWAQYALSEVFYAAEMMVLLWLMAKAEDCKK